MADFGTILNPNNTSLDLYCNSIRTSNILTNGVAFLTVGSNTTNTYVDVETDLILYYPIPAYALEYRNITGVNFEIRGNGDITGILFNGLPNLRTFYTTTLSGFIVNPNNAVFSIRVFFDNTIRNVCEFDNSVKPTSGFFSITTGFRIVDNNSHRLGFTILGGNTNVNIIGLTTILNQY